MIEFKEAISAATASIADFYQGKELPGLLLEEVTLDEKEGCWLITLGFYAPANPNGQGLGGLMAPSSPERKYKTFKINAQTGKTLSMTIREP
jgi:hypothetical protein